MPDVSLDAGWLAVLGSLSAHQDLTADVVEAAGVAAILDGGASLRPDRLHRRPAHEGRDRGGAVRLLRSMLAASERLELSPDGVIDIVGTGGDRHHSINVSTLAALGRRRRLRASTATEPPPRRAGRRTCSRRSAWSSSSASAGVARCVARAGIGFKLSAPTCRCATPGRPDASSGSRPSSTSSDRWPTRPGPAATWWA